jgi:integral membrane protein (TIGR01906 family)
VTAPATVGGGARRGLAQGAVAVATALVIVGITIAIFFNPLWVGFAQGRADAAAWTGWTPAQVEAVTRDIVVEVWVGPGTFAQDVDGEAVFTDRERSHMADVRQLVLAFYAVVGAAAFALVVLGFASAWSRTYWRSVALGAKVLAVGTVAVGIAFAVFFDRAFTLFHQLFFAEGTWTFDPATDRLVQLFPYQFWTETTIAIAVVGFGLTALVWAVASRLGRPPRTPAAAVGALAGGGDAS